jgi:cytosine/adenosine deaminase-related metal-dependent hydrolase
MTAIYSARWVMPIASAPIENGAIAVAGKQIVRVGKAAEIALRYPDALVSDFGTSAILPGLVNAHSHLELTVMRGFLEAEEHDFFAWLRKLTVARLGMTADDLSVSATCGAIEAARAGITCVGDSSSAAAQSMKAVRETGLRGIVYQESFGPDPRVAADNIAKLRAQLIEMRARECEQVRAGVSPHAPYTVSAPQLEMISRLALEEKLPLMMHAAESPAEAAFMRDGTGAFAEGLRTRGIEWDPPGISTVQYLEQHHVLETKPLLAHCITVDDRDLETVRQAGAAIAHCPKSNAKLRHGRAPLAKFISAGLKVGLGSDSVASNNNCDILEEARFATLLARSSIDDSLGPAPESQTAVHAMDVLFAATLGGARALGLDDHVGALSEGMQADVVIVRLDGPHQQPVTDPISTLIFSSSGRDVRLTMVAGKEIYRDGHLLTADEPAFESRLATVRQKLEK